MSSHTSRATSRIRATSQATRNRAAAMPSPAVAIPSPHNVWPILSNSNSSSHKAEDLLHQRIPSDKDFKLLSTQHYTFDYLYDYYSDYSYDYYCDYYGDYYDYFRSVKNSRSTCRELISGVYWHISYIVIYRILIIYRILPIYSKWYVHYKRIARSQTRSSCCAS